MAAPATITITECTQNPDNNLYDVTFQTHQIKTTVTADPAVVSTWISAVESSPHLPRPLLIGIDVEWRPNFTRQSDNPIATIQLCVGPTCLIFQLLHCRPHLLPKSLSDFLANDNHSFVGVGILTDVEKLVCDYGLSVRRAVDLADLAAAKAVARRGSGLKELARVVVGVEVSKPKRVTMSRWDAEWLSYQQIQYACVDAFLSFEIGRRLMASPP